MAESAMLTARIPADTKELAAANLKRMGYTASLTIQAIWQYLASTSVEDGKRFLEPVMRKEKTASEKRREAFERSKKLILTPQKYEELFGIKVDGPLKPLSDEELEAEREQRYMEKYYGERLQ